MPDAFGNIVAGDDVNAAPAAAPPVEVPAVGVNAPRDTMMPGPIMSTSHKSLPTRESDGEAWATKGGVVGDQPSSFPAIAAAANAYANAPNFLSPGTEQAIKAQPGWQGWFGRNISIPTSHLLGTGAGGLAAVGSAIGSTASGLADDLGLSDATRRNIMTTLSSIPAGAADLTIAPRVAAPTIPGPAGPRFVEPWVVPASKLKGLLSDAAETAPMSPTNIPGPMAPPADYVPPAAPTPTSSAEMKPIADFKYAVARASGADLLADAADRFRAKVTDLAKPTGPGTEAITGPNSELSNMADRLNAQQGQPYNISDVIGMDSQLNGLKRATNNPVEATTYGNIQDALRAQIDATTQANVAGGAAGWQAFSEARDAWSQYKKMQDLEDIRNTALGKNVPAEQMRSGVSAYLNDPKASAGVTDPERAVIAQAGERGIGGEVVRSLGSRVFPFVAGGAGAALGGLFGGGLGAAVAAPLTTAVTSVGSTLLRRAATGIQAARIQDALNVLGSKTPYPPEMPRGPYAP